MMNHDYAHCLDYCSKCPKTCFRGELVRDLRNRPDLAGCLFTFSHFKSTEECPLSPKKDRPAVLRKHSRKELYQKDRDCGMTYQQIADKHGVSKQAISQHLRGYNPVRFQYVTAEGCIYEGLRQWMNENKVSRSELCRRMGISCLANNVATLSNFMRNGECATKKYIDRILQVTGLTYEELFRRD